MRQFIIVEPKRDGTISAEWGRLYSRQRELPSQIEPWFYVFGELRYTKRSQFETDWFLIGGEGIKTCRNETELADLLERIRASGIEFAIVGPELIHTKVDVSN